MQTYYKDISKEITKNKGYDKQDGDAIQKKPGVENFRNPPEWMKGKVTSYSKLSIRMLLNDLDNTGATCCILMTWLLATVAGSATHEPIDAHYSDNDGVHGRDIIHVARGNRAGIREAVHDESEEGPGKEDNVADQAEWAEPEWTVTDIIAASDEKADNGDGIWDVQQDDACRDHAVGLC